MTWCGAFFILLAFTIMYLFADLWFIPRIREVKLKKGGKK